MASTIITTNAASLSRAADTIASKDGKISKNGILNAISAAIFGQGKDWGYIKNAPDGRLTQPGLETEKSASPAITEVWLFTSTDGAEGQATTEIFLSKADALKSLAENHQDWRHEDHPFETVIHALATQGYYRFASYDCEADEYFDAYLFELEQRFLGPKADDDKSDYSTAEGIAYLKSLSQPRTMFLSGLPAAFCSHSPRLEDGRLFRDLDHVEEVAEDLGFDEKLPNWREQLHYVKDCEITAEFEPQEWVDWLDDYAVEADIDDEKDLEWNILPEELNPDKRDFDDLQFSQNAPQWVRDWDGPFLVRVSLTPPAKTK